MEHIDSVHEPASPLPEEGEFNMATDQMKTEFTDDVTIKKEATEADLEELPKKDGNLTPMKERESVSPDQADRQVVEWHCAECDIWFGSFNNFKAHKQFYCATRNKQKVRKVGQNLELARSNALLSQLQHLQAANNLQNFFPGKVAPPHTSPTSSLLPFMQAGMFMPMILPTPFGMTYAMVPCMPTLGAPLPDAQLGKTSTSSSSIEKESQQENDSSSSKAAPKPQDAHTSEDNSGQSKLSSEQPLDLSQGGKEARLCDDVSSKSPRILSTSPEPGEIGRHLPRPTSLIESILSLTKQQPLWHSKPNPSVRQQVNKCSECDIVFFKEENFRAHKDMYCAGRHLQGKQKSFADQNISQKQTTAAPEVTQARQNRSPRAPTTRSPGSESPEEYQLQYVCLPCNIRFSSLDTLNAHQEFYCPARQASGTNTLALRSPRRLTTSVNKPTLDTDARTCCKCLTVLASAEEMLRHECKQAPLSTTMKIPVYCCPHCDFVASGEQRLLDHIKSHAPVKAYRCQLCGYRGNTVRGMRMHGKSTHMDSGERFTDDNIIEFHEPRVLPKRLRTSTESVQVHLARANAHLQSPSSIRKATHPVCNELTRKRSQPTAPTSPTHQDAVVGDKITTNDEVVSSKRPKLAVTSSPKTNFKIATILGHDEDSKAEAEGSTSKNRMLCDPVTAENSPAVEKDDVTAESSHATNDTAERASATNYCQDCDIKFVYLSTFLAHKKHYCTSHRNERKTATPSEA